MLIMIWYLFACRQLALQNMYKYRLGPFWGILNFEFQYFLLVFRKMNLFWGLVDFVDKFLGDCKFGLYFCVISMLIRVFSYS